MQQGTLVNFSLLRKECEKRLFLYFSILKICGFFGRDEKDMIGNIEFERRCNVCPAFKQQRET